MNQLFNKILIAATIALMSCSIQLLPAEIKLKDLQRIGKEIDTIDEQLYDIDNDRDKVNPRLITKEHWTIYFDNLKKPIVARQAKLKAIGDYFENLPEACESVTAQARTLQDQYQHLCDELLSWIGMMETSRNDFASPEEVQQELQIQALQILGNNPQLAEDGSTFFHVNTSPVLGQAPFNRPEILEVEHKENRPRPCFQGHLRAIRG